MQPAPFPSALIVWGLHQGYQAVMISLLELRHHERLGLIKNTF